MFLNGKEIVPETMALFSVVTLGVFSAGATGERCKPP